MLENKIILLSGRAGVGKTTSADYLVENYGLVKLSFATGVKETARFMGWNGIKDEKGRKLLQSIGSAGRDYDIDTWVKGTYNTIKQLSNYAIIVIDDWRFPNEALYFYDRKLKTTLVRIIAPEREILKGKPEYNDISETALTDADPFYNLVIDNSKDFEALYKQLQTLINIINL